MKKTIDNRYEIGEKIYFNQLSTIRLVYNNEIVYCCKSYNKNILKSKINYKNKTKLDFNEKNVNNISSINEYDRILNEIKIFKIVNVNKYICNLKEIIENEKKIYIIMKYYKLGSFFKM